MMNNKKQKVLIFLLLVVVLTLSVGSYFKFKPQISDGTKHITFTVITDTNTESFDITTDADYLSQALEENGLLDGYEGDYGLFVTTVNSITADEQKEEWWCFTKSGEIVMTGVDTTPIFDSDSFEATLKVGYN